MSDNWPFGTDAKQDDPLTALRIPVVGSFNPMWKYVAAFVDVDPDCPFDPPWPFASVERPTDAEAAMLASFIAEYNTHWFNERWLRKLAERALDVDSGNNTTVFIKYGPDDWAYRMTSWQYGPTFAPDPPNFTDRKIGPLSLEQVMDRRHTIGDGPMPHWLDWKAAHPDVFPPAGGVEVQP